MNRVIIYVRVSTEDQVEKFGLPAQIRACREYAAARGWEIVEEIADEGISGAILSRPGIDRVRQLVRDHAADIVLTLDPDRLSRELVHLLILKPEIERNARLEFVAATFESSPTGRLFFSMKGAIAEYEREVTRDRTMRGKRERAKSGLLVGGREPYGYRYSAGALLVDAERGPITQQIFEWADAGCSIREITRRLRASGAPTWGGGKWGHSSVRCVLVNEVYAGVARWGGEQISVPALVDRELWTRVRARIAQNPHVGRPTAAYLLRGLLYCHCGLRMYGESGQRCVAYRCRGRNAMRFENPCRVAVNATKLDAAAWGCLVDVFTDAAALRGLLRDREEQLRIADPAQAERLRVRLKKLRSKESAALSLMLDADLSEDRAAIKMRLAVVRAERVQVESELAEIERASAPASLGWIDETVGLFQRQMPQLDPALRQQFVRGIMTRADWTGEELKMRLFVGPKLTRTSQQNGQFRPLELVVTARLAA